MESPFLPLGATRSARHVQGSALVGGILKWMATTTAGPPIGGQGSRVVVRRHLGSSVRGRLDIERDTATNKFQLPPLPYAKTALQPHMSKETLNYHHGKHLAAYVNKVNELTSSSSPPPVSSSKTHSPIPPSRKTIVELMISENGVLFNQAAQVWNHTFFFECLQPPTQTTTQKDPNEPSGLLKNFIDVNFGSFQKFKDQFVDVGMKHFGSGWVWLVFFPHGGEDGHPKLEIQSTSDAMNPLRAGGGFPLLTCDLWEHAYYVDYRNNRKQFLEEFWHLVNWRFVEENLKESIQFANKQNV